MLKKLNTYNQTTRNSLLQPDIMMSKKKILKKELELQKQNRNK
jgi:hypothetical protein